MLEPNAVRRWIQPHHLDERSLEEYRRALDSHGARAIVLRSFLIEDVALKVSRFLSSEVEYETCYGLYSREAVNHHATEGEWNAAEEDDRFYRYGRMARCLPAYRLSPNLMTFVQFRSAWSDAPFAGFFQQVTGLPLAASPLDSVNAFSHRDFLRVHADALEDRRLGVVLYLSQGWRPEFGGALELIDRQGNVTTVTPAFNSVLLFDVRAGSTHQVLPVRSEAEGQARLTMGGWLGRGPALSPTDPRAMRRTPSVTTRDRGHR